MKKRLLTAWCLLLGGCLAAEPEFKPKKVLAPFKPILNPNIVEAAEGAKFVRDDELVLGVAINGKARAYSINTLTTPRREIINDTLGGTPIAATW